MKYFLVHNCNFCGSNNIRFDVFITTIHKNSYYQHQIHWEAFSQCSHCKKGCILIIQKGNNFRDLYPNEYSSFDSNLCLNEKTNINDHFEVNRLLIPPTKNQRLCPHSVPETIKDIFDEATKCLSMSCFVASGSMFRLCLDLVTKDLLNKFLEENQTSEHQLNKDQRNKLANRIDFLIEKQKIPKRLEELAHCIRHDGNDSAHDGNTGENEALDCLDFTEALLTEIYTVPEQIKESSRRRLERRAKS
ncbi:DUF4145 domain-containing protein [Acinetobacter cumulans]|uniref:DUF4145 domain-containing protein n=1 Tax=Acinetobacter TaxID=469 RepID=UPI000D137DDA|nr:MULTISPECIES: DUF4145 domain-containing protein [Acinetobacter]QCO20117.1 DUF4145 domain-containing protein [Acinetobacter cumulans]RFS35985.1 DUF4145 domain-containing protein [Acinetobacter sp. SWAC5]